MSELTKELIEHFRSTNGRIELTRAGTLKIDGEKITPSNMLSVLQRAAIENSKFQPLLLTPPAEVINGMRLYITRSARSRPDYQETTVQNYDYSDLIPFQSITDSSNFVIFDVRKGEITDLDYNSFKMNPETSKVDVVRGRIEFNPYYPKQIDFRNDMYGRPCNFLNVYKKPLWQLGEDIGSIAGSAYRPNELFFEFMNHLIPDPECRFFVFDWLHHALTGRCETYLVLNGAKGIGKNLFSESLCKPLMGSNNHKIAQPSALTSDFNALLANSRMIVFDEFKIDSPEKINKLKRYVNEEQMIERKGVDVAASVKTYNSFIISNNDMSDMKISWDDRRFSVMDLTSVKLRDVWTDDKIKELLELFEDEEEMRNIGYWLMYREPRYTKFDAWKGEHFYQLCYSSFSEWQKILIDFAMQGKDFVTSSDLRKEYRKRTESTRLPSVVRIRDFINSYRHRGIGKLGTISSSEGEVWTLQYSEEFTKPALERPSITDDVSQLLGDGDLFA